MATNMQGKWVQGNFIYFDSGVHADRWVYGLGHDVHQYLDDFTRFPVDDTTGDPVEWTTTVVEIGAGSTTIASTDLNTGGVLITTAANENDGGSYQLKGESFSLAAGNQLYYAVRFKANDVTQTDWFLGLSITSTAILAGVTDRIGFQSLDGSTDLKLAVEKDSTETLSSALHTMVDDTFVVAEFIYNGSTLRTYIDGVSGGTVATTNLPDNELMRISIEFLTGEAVANNMTIDWIRCIQVGRN